MPPVNHPRRANGQSMVEFGLVLPLVVALIAGVMVACWLYFQSSSVDDGAKAGARMATIETSLISGTSGSQTNCESGAPTKVEVAVQQAAPQVPVNSGALCETSPNHWQQAAAPGRASITIDEANPGAPNETITVTVTYTAQGAVFPLNKPFVMSASSTLSSWVGQS